MTPKQVKLLDFIRSRIEETASSPTYAEMAAHLGVARSHAHLLVDELIWQGQLKKTPGRKCGLALVAPYRSITDVPTSLLRAELARREAAI